MLEHTRQTKGMSARSAAAAAIEAAGWETSARTRGASYSRPVCLISVGLCPVVGRLDSRPAVGFLVSSQQPNSGRGQT